MSLPAAESSDRPHASTSFWRDVAHALKGEQHDYTAESLNRAVLLLAVPMVLEMLMESLFAVVDVFWVSRLGRDAVAVIGLTESVMSLIYAVAIGISFAATAIVARRIGEKDPERAARSAAQIVMLGVTIVRGPRRAARLVRAGHPALDGRKRRRSSSSAPTSRASCSAATSPCS